MLEKNMIRIFAKLPNMNSVGIWMCKSTDRERVTSRDRKRDQGERYFYVGM